MSSQIRAQNAEPKVSTASGAQSSVVLTAPPSAVPDGAQVKNWVAVVESTNKWHAVPTAQLELKGVHTGTQTPAASSDPVRLMHLSAEEQSLSPLHMGAQSPASPDLGSVVSTLRQ